MNTLTKSTTTVKGASRTVPAAGIAYLIGEMDAMRGDTCCPEMIFTHIDDKRDYCAGYESVGGPTITTRYFLGADH